MIAVLKQLLVLYVFLFVGWFFGKRKKNLSDQTSIISFLLVNLFMPCLTFNTFSKNFTVSYIKNNGTTIIFSVSLLVLLALLSIPVSKLMTKNSYEQRVYKYSVPISNYAYLGYVLVEDLFGSTGLADMMLFCLPFGIYTYSFGYSILTGRGKSLKRIINPIIISIFLGMIVGLTGFEMPAVVTKILTTSSSCVGPLSMILTGLTLSSFSLKDLAADKKAYIFTAIRLIVLPAFVWGLCELVGLIFTLPESIKFSALLISCMPCGLNPIVFPKLIGEDCTPGARLALLTHTFSCVTLPIWISILM
jgi:predicted permease